MTRPRPWCDMPDNECVPPHCDGRGCALSTKLRHKPGNLITEWLAEKWRDELVAQYEHGVTGRVLYAVRELLMLIDAEREAQVDAWCDAGIDPAVAETFELRLLRELLAALEVACEEAAYRIDGTDPIWGHRSLTP